MRCRRACGGFGAPVSPRPPSCRRRSASTPLPCRFAALRGVPVLVMMRLSVNPITCEYHTSPIISTLVHEPRPYPIHPPRMPGVVNVSGGWHLQRASCNWRRWLYRNNGNHILRGSDPMRPTPKRRAGHSHPLGRSSTSASRNTLNTSTPKQVNTTCSTVSSPARNVPTVPTAIRAASGIG